MTYSSLKFAYILAALLAAPFLFVSVEKANGDMGNADDNANGAPSPFSYPAPAIQNPSNDEDPLNSMMESLPIAPDHGDEASMYEEVSKSTRHNKSRQKGAARFGDRDKPLVARLDGFSQEIAILKSDKPKQNREWHDALSSVIHSDHSVTWNEITEKADVTVDFA